ncbi:MAG TPA: hypothetical protein VH113_01550 [Gemmatimonadales bacterium]|nr:hypothetical protein [Gemmatimonadales bacterium]
MKHLWLAAALVCIAHPLAAQTCTATVTAGAGSCSTAQFAASMTVNAVVQLTLSTTTTSLTAPGSADYDAGFVADAGPSATVQCNVTCRLQISAATASWSATATTSVPPRSKPCADLTWSTSAGGPFVGLTTSPATVQSVPATGGSAPVSLFYQTNYSWGADTPGNYSLTVVFTLAAP